MESPYLIFISAQHHKDLIAGCGQTIMVKCHTATFAITIIHICLHHVVTLGKEIVNKERWRSQQKTSADSTKGQV